MKNKKKEKKQIVRSLENVQNDHEKEKIARDYETWLSKIDKGKFEEKLKQFPDVFQNLDQKGHSIAHCIVLLEDKKKVKFFEKLVEHCGNHKKHEQLDLKKLVNMLDQEGNAPLHTLLQHVKNMEDKHSLTDTKKSDMFKLLLKHGANIDQCVHDKIAQLNSKHKTKYAVLVLKNAINLTDEERKKYEELKDKGLGKQIKEKWEQAKKKCLVGLGQFYNIVKWIYNNSFLIAVFTVAITLTFLVPVLAPITLPIVFLSGGVMMFKSVLPSPVQDILKPCKQAMEDLYSYLKDRTPSIENMFTSCKQVMENSYSYLKNITHPIYEVLGFTDQKKSQEKDGLAQDNHKNDVPAHLKDSENVQTNKLNSHSDKQINVLKSPVNNSRSQEDLQKDAAHSPNIQNQGQQSDSWVKKERERREQKNCITVPKLHWRTH